MKAITVTELKSWMDTNEDFQLIDCREQHEYDHVNINGELIPMGDIPNHIDKISEDKKVVIHCRSGARSASAIQFLEKAHGFDNLYNLTGGILAWSDQIDPSKPKY